MPFKLKAPRPGRTPYYSVRGTYCGVHLDQSTGVTDRATAERIRKKWERDAEGGLLASPGEPTFLDAVVGYIEAGGDPRFLGKEDSATGLWTGIAGKLGSEPLSAINQQRIDQIAIELYPEATPATRNRQVHTPISAVLKHAGIERKLRRPKGWRGNRRADFMQPPQAFKLLAAAAEVEPEFGCFLTFLLYTGVRLSEGLGLRCDKVNLPEAWAYVSKTKTGKPRMVHLPPILVAALANHPRTLDRNTNKVFRFIKCGRLYTLLKRAKEQKPDLAFVTFHTFRHTWATWMRRYGGLDTTGLVNTKTWADEASARIYEHLDVTEEARKANLLPVPEPNENPGEIRGNGYVKRLSA